MPKYLGRAQRDKSWQLGSGCFSAPTFRFGTLEMAILFAASGRSSAFANLGNFLKKLSARPTEMPGSKFFEQSLLTQRRQSVLQTHCPK